MFELKFSYQDFLSLFVLWLICFPPSKEWLSELSAQMKETLKQLLYECVSAGRKGEVDPSRYPSQVNTSVPGD